MTNPNFDMEVALAQLREGKDLTGAYQKDARQRSTAYSPIPQPGSSAIIASTPSNNTRAKSSRPNSCKLGKRHRFHT